MTSSHPTHKLNVVALLKRKASSPGLARSQIPLWASSSMVMSLLHCPGSKPEGLLPLLQHTDNIYKNNAVGMASLLFCFRASVAVPTKCSKSKSPKMWRGQSPVALILSWVDMILFCIRLLDSKGGLFFFPPPSDPNVVSPTFPDHNLSCCI